MNSAPHIEVYRQSKHNVRLLRRELALAHQLQRQGKTLSEIAIQIGAPTKAVEQSLYWDVVAR